MFLRLVALEVAKHVEAILTHSADIGLSVVECCTVVL